MEIWREILCYPETALLSAGTPVFFALASMFKPWLDSVATLQVLETRHYSCLASFEAIVSDLTKGCLSYSSISKPGLKRAPIQKLLQKSA